MKPGKYPSFPQLTRNMSNYALFDAILNATTNCKVMYRM